MRRSSAFLLPLVAIVTAPFAGAATEDQFGVQYTPQKDAAGGEMMTHTADSVNSITNLLMGPGMYVIMAIGAIIALYGFGRGQKETLFTGIGLFVFAAIIRGIWAYIGGTHL